MHVLSPRMDPPEAVRRSTSARLGLLAASPRLPGGAPLPTLHRPREDGTRVVGVGVGGFGALAHQDFERRLVLAVVASEVEAEADAETGAVGAG